jgi:hypothetical protein
MKHLKLFVMIVFLLLVALTGTAMLYGRALAADGMTSPLLAMGIDNCDGKLCFMQVVPGITTRYEALEAMRGKNIRDEGNHFHANVPGLAIRVDAEDYDEPVRRVDIQSSGGPGSGFSVPFRQLIEQFGTPCFVSVNEGRSGSRVLSLTYPSFTVQIYGEDDRLSLNSEITGITIQNSSGTSNLCQGMYSYYGTPWRGFASVDVYEAESYRDR